MAQKKVYDKEFKVQAVKLGREIGFSKTAKELGINIDTLYGWNKRAKDARLDLGLGTQTPDTAMNLTEEVQKIRQQNREQTKEIARLKEENEFLAEASAFFCSEPSEVSKSLRMRFIDIKTEGGTVKGKIAFYCDVLGVTRQGFYWYLKHREDPWKYEGTAEKMRGIVAEDECNDTYGRCRMYQALKLKYPDEDIPSERTVYRIMEEIGLSHRPNGITKADRNARRSDDLLKRDFMAERPLEKCVTDITEIPARDGKLYVSAIFDCYDLGVLGLAMTDNMKAGLCVSTIENAAKAFPAISGAIIHSDRGSQYTSASYRAGLSRYGLVQSMNSDGSRCHDTSICEAM